MPVESPTVPNADTASKSSRSRSSPVMIMSRAVATTTAATAMSTTVIACRCTARESRLPKMFTAPSPRSSVIMMKKSTANVVTLMPPAVPAGPPPMNISTSMPSQVSSFNWPMSSELNPAVRVCTDWKKPASTRAAGSSSPSVAGLFHSSAVM